MKDAQLHPPPIQRPRPPLTIAAHGPRTLKVAATYGDAWSTLVGGDLAAGEALRVTRERNQLVSEHAAQAGRDPRGIVRSLTVGWTRDTPFWSLQAFYDFVGSYREVGITEFVFGYWTRAENSPEVDHLPHLTDDGMLQRIAGEAIPTLTGRSSAA